MFLVLEQLQTATCIREKSEPEISGNLLDSFGDEKQNKSDTYIYIYDTYESAAWSKPGGGACLHAPNDASAEG